MNTCVSSYFSEVNTATSGTEKYVEIKKYIQSNIVKHIRSSFKDTFTRVIDITNIKNKTQSLVYGYEIIQEEKFDFITIENRCFKFKEGITLYYEKIEDVYRISSPELDFDVLANSITEGKEVFFEELLFRWDDYAQEEDSNLGELALKIKNRFLYYIIEEKND